MKKALQQKLITITAIALLLGNFSVNAQGIGNPPPDPDDGDDVGDEIETPIDGFIWISLLAGGIYGLKRFSKTPKA
ncbi:MAG: hypothetical protein ACQESK_00650 [Bacteroidota bacterium]